jgi:hypothetical protein
MVNLEKLVGWVGPDINASSTNDSEEESGVQVLWIGQLNYKSDRARERQRECNGAGNLAGVTAGLTLLNKWTTTRSPLLRPAFLNPAMSFLTSVLVCAALRLRDAQSASMYSGVLLLTLT